VETPAEFAGLVKTHQGIIRGFLRRLTRNATLADDLAQMTFMKAYERRLTLKDPKAAKSWLIQIAYRTFVDHTRKAKRRSDLAEQQPDEEQVSKVPGLSLDIAKAMDSLSDDCRAVVLLCLVHGMTHDEISRVTNLPLGTVKSHVTRGKTKLRAFLHAYES